MKDMLLNVRNGVQHSLNIMPPPTPLSSTLIVKVVVIASIAGAGAYGGSIIASPLEIQIFNHGCPPIAGEQNFPIPVGVTLPSTPIRSGEMGVITIPQMIATITTSNDGMLSIGVLGNNFPIQQGGSISDIQFDGVSVIGHSKSLSLSERQQHKIDVFCK